MRRRLACQSGLSLVELIVVLVITTIIFGPIVNSFVSALNEQARQLDVATAQEQARLALQRMRKDIHCAHGVTTPAENSSDGYTLILTETNTTGTAECPGLISQDASAVEWCTIPIGGSSSEYDLYRENNANDSCEAGASTFEVGDISQANLWSVPTCTGGEYPAVAVSIPVEIDLSSTQQGTYDLADQIALRNGTPCT